MIYALYALFILSCVVLILSVLLQPGKADAGALFTSSVSSTTFGPRGTQTLLAKITIIAASLFMLTALAISFGVGRPRSVMQSGVPDQPATQQQQPAPAAPQQQEGSAPTTPADGTQQNVSTGDNANTATTPSTSGSPQNQASPEKKN